MPPPFEHPRENMVKLYQVQVPTNPCACPGSVGLISGFSVPESAKAVVEYLGAVVQPVAHDSKALHNASAVAVHVGDITLIGYSRDNSESLLKALSELICGTLNRRAVYMTLLWRVNCQL